MTRLTNEDGICVNCDGIAYCKEDCIYKQVYYKLKHYEDLGFTPEEIAYMAKFYKDKNSIEEIECNMKVAAKLIEWAKWKDIMQTYDKEEVWSAIKHLSEIRSGFGVFDNQECSTYHACSLAIKALREVIGER